jgi:hypothetical protein
MRRVGDRRFKQSKVTTGIFPGLEVCLTRKSGKMPGARSRREQRNELLRKKDDSQ